MLKWINKKRNKKGFTLVELVVVIAILGILAGIAVPRLSNSRDSAAISSHNANVRALESAATIAVAENDFTAGDSGKWDGSTDDKGKKYVQEWPSVPKQIIDNENIVLEKDGTSKIATGATYVVTFKADGSFEVTPGKVKKK